jgi:hypothetical protein
MTSLLILINKITLLTTLLIRQAALRTRTLSKAPKEQINNKVTIIQRIKKTKVPWIYKALNKIQNKTKDKRKLNGLI